MVNEPKCILPNGDYKEVDETETKTHSASYSTTIHNTH